MMTNRQWLNGLGNMEWLVQISVIKEGIDNGEISIILQWLDEPHKEVGNGRNNL